jgi:DNA-binding transcriptional LysR family regulator
VPTPYGRALIRRSIAAFDELSQGVKDIEFLADPTTGEVRIAAPIATAAAFLAAVIDTLARRHPRVVCHLITGESATLCALGMTAPTPTIALRSRAWVAVSVVKSLNLRID